MEVTETNSEGLKRAYTAKATAAEIEARINSKLEEVQPTAQLKGFRKGKVPLSLLKKMFAKSMLGEAMQEMVDELVSSILKRNNIARRNDRTSRSSMRPSRKATI